MILPITYQTAQQVRAAQQGTFRRCLASDHDMVTPTRTYMAAIHHEFLGAQTREPGLFVQNLCISNQFVPTTGGRNIHLNDSRVRRDLEDLEARVVRRMLPLKDDRQVKLASRFFDGTDKGEVIFRSWKGRDEDVKAAFARFNAQGGAGNPGGGLMRLRPCGCVHHAARARAVGSLADR